MEPIEYSEAVEPAREPEAQSPPAAATAADAAFHCHICEEASAEICGRCTRDVCDNHLCERCGQCSDCCTCDEHR